MNIRNSLTEIVSELGLDPTSKVATLREDFNLALEGSRELIAKRYVLYSPLAFVGKMPDGFYLYRIDEVTPPYCIGILSSDKLLIRNNDSEYDLTLVSQVLCSKDIPSFVLFAELEGFAEVYMVTPKIGTPLHFLFPAEKADQLLGLCNEVITAVDQKAGEQMEQMLRLSESKLDELEDECDLNNHEPDCYHLYYLITDQDTNLRSYLCSEDDHSGKDV